MLGCHGRSAPAWRPQRQPAPQSQLLLARRVASTCCQAGRRGDVLLIAEGIGKTHDGDKMLFEGLSLTVKSGQKLAVVGPNGAGKSTLLRILAGTADPDAGSLNRNRGAKVGYLPQGDLLLDADAQARLDSMTVLQAVLASDSEMARAVQDYQRVLATCHDDAMPELAAALDRMNALNAWDLDSEAKRMLEAVGLTNPNAQVGGLSGGQRRRLALAAALLGGPDLLVFDEPTNHMDVDMISWMEEEILAAEDMALLMVSHDRYFMERTCNQLLELDFGATYMHPFGGAGSYEGFQAARQARRHAQMNAVADARKLHQREAEWMSRQPKARSTKAKARVDAFYELTEKTKALPQADVRPEFGNVAMVRQGNKAIAMKGIGYRTPTGRQLLDNFTWDFSPGERWGIAGRNGVGKTALLDLIAGVKAPAAGEREVGVTSAIGYFTQYPPDVDEGLRMIDYIRSIADDSKARRSGLQDSKPPEVLLEQLGFPRKRQFQKVASLSGGERRRLHLAAVLTGAPNVLILDEPTNDLDLATVEVVEDFLSSFNGLLLVVSHDRAFMDNAVDRLLVVTGDGAVRLFEGCYSDYLEARAAEEAAATAAAAAGAGQRQDAAAAAAASKTGPRAGASTSGGGGGGGGAAAAGKPGAAQQQQQQQRSSAPPAAQSGGKAGGGNGKGGGSSSGGQQAQTKRKLGYFEQQEYQGIDAQVAQLSGQRDALNGRLVEMGAAGSTDLAALEAVSLELAALQEKIDALEARWFELAEIAGDI